MELFEDLQLHTDHTHVITVITSHANEKSLFGKKKYIENEFNFKCLSEIEFGIANK